jgi:hypothetical protein
LAFFELIPPQIVAVSTGDRKAALPSPIVTQGVDGSYPVMSRLERLFAWLAGAPPLVFERLEMNTSLCAYTFQRIERSACLVGKGKMSAADACLGFSEVKANISLLVSSFSHLLSRASTSFCIQKENYHREAPSASSTPWHRDAVAAAEASALAAHAVPAHSKRHTRKPLSPASLYSLSGSSVFSLRLSLHERNMPRPRTS